MSKLLDEPIEEIYQLAAYLHHWGYGSIINTITHQTIYRIKSNSPINIDSQIYLSFLTTFNISTDIKSNHKNYIGIDYDYSILSTILSLYNGMKNLSDIISNYPNELQQLSIDITIWLLRRNIIEEVE